MFDALATTKDFSLRRMSEDLFQTTMGHVFGIVDEDRPNTDQVDDNYRGLMYRLLQIRAHMIATGIMQSQVMRRTGQEEMDAVEETHPWAALMASPNPNHSAYQVWFWAALMRDLEGSADFVVDRGTNGVPTGIYPIFPAFGDLREIPNGQGGVQAYIFDRVFGDDKRFDPEDIIRIKEIDPTDPHKSSSLLQKAGFEVETDWYASKYSRDVLRDGTHPPGLLRPDSDVTMGEDQGRKFSKQFARDYMGKNSVKGLPVLPPGFSLEKSPFTPEELQLTDGRELNKEMLYEITGVPPIFSKDNNRANIDGIQRVLVKFTLEPEVQSIDSQLTHQFTRSFRADEGVLFIEPPNLMPEDKLEEQQLREKQLATGQATPNEFRSEDGKDEYDGGDQYFIKGNLLPIGGGREDPPQPPAEE